MNARCNLRNGPLSHRSVQGKPQLTSVKQPGTIFGGSRPFNTRSVLDRRTELHAAAGGGGTIGGAGGSSGGGGGGDAWGGRGDGDDAKKDESILWKGWNARVAADPQFAYKVFIEQVIGVGASVVGDMSSRPNWGLNELDFVFATLIVGSIVNFALMYLLAPTGPAIAGAAASSGIVAKIFGDHMLLKMGAPPGHMFQPGFSVVKRVLNFGYKGCIFAFIGLCAGLVGTAVSNGLLVARKKFDPNFVIQNTPPNVLANASCWALHMGVSSNLRYQILNGMDMILQPAMPSGVFRTFTSVIRGANNAVGGISFVVLAKLLGVQKAAEAAPEPKGKKGKKK